MDKTGGILHKEWDERLEQQYEKIVEAMREAIKEEYKARALYLNLARNLNDPALRTVFESLASDEESHAKRITAIIELMSSMNKKIEHAEVEALADHLTGLGNRRQFDKHLDAAAARVRRGGGSLGLLVVDLDNFKEINDTQGHDNGDRILVAVGNALSTDLRQGQDTVFRWGGDEFAVVVERTDEKGFRILADKVIGIVRDVEVPFGTRIEKVTASVGGALMPQNAEDVSNLFKQADKAAYAAKEAGGDRVVLSQRSPDHSVEGEDY